MEFFLLLYCQHHPGGCLSWCDKKTKIQNSYAIKKDIKNYIVWNMCFKRLVLNACSLSVALYENGKLLDLVETAWLKLSSGINNSFWSRFHNLQKDLLYLESSSVVLEILCDPHTTLSQNLLVVQHSVKRFCKLIGRYWKIKRRQF